MCGCNEPTPCVPCSSCDTPACNNVCKYTGENIEGLGIFKNENISTAIEKIAEYLLNNVNPISNNIVKLLTTNNIQYVISGFPTIGNSSTLVGTTYQVPVNGQGEYDVYYEGQITFSQTSELKLGFYKNGSLVGVIRSIRGLTNTTIPFSFSQSDIALAQGDSIDIRAVAQNTGLAINFGSQKVIKK
jgi:Tfp pilus assembly protein FimT